MALTTKDITEFLFLNLGENYIGNKGCVFLSQALWPKMDYLDLYLNNITSEGVNNLFESDWPWLKYLYLSTFVMIRL